MVIEELFPRSCSPSWAVSESFGDAAGPQWLFPEEEFLVAEAVPERRREFADVRACARSALARLGREPVPILRGERGAPVWPEAVVGSMTHCPGYRGAVVAGSDTFLSVGLDAEPNQPLGDSGVLARVMDADERRSLPGLSASRPDICWDRLVFSAKESVYKAWYPLTGRWLGFDQALVTVDVPARTFFARFLVPGPVAGGTVLTGFHGSWTVCRGLLFTAVSVHR